MPVAEETSPGSIFPRSAVRVGNEFQLASLPHSGEDYDFPTVAYSLKHRHGPQQAAQTDIFAKASSMSQGGCQLIGAPPL
jgi:hypothetical protein